MDSVKLEMVNTPAANNDSLPTYKAIPEADIEEESVSRPKNLLNLKPLNSENDGADEKMLPQGNKISIEEKNDKQNGGTKLGLGETNTYVGIGKEELMKYANDPFWVRLRWFLFVSFWLLWAGMLLGAVLIIYAAPKCDPPPPRTWWQKGPLAEISSKTKIEELKRLKENGVQGFIVDWLEDSYVIPNDSEAISQLLQQSVKEDINIIVGLEPGNSMVWFGKSENFDDTVNDYYIWHDGNKTSTGEFKPPNKWLNILNNSSWMYSQERKQYFYAPHAKPHLNFRNENVTNEFSSVIRHFLSIGAAGIRIRNAKFLLVDSKLEDEEPNRQNTQFDLGDYRFYDHKKTENLPELGALLREWRKVVKNLTNSRPLLVNEQLERVESYKFNGTLMVDLPLQASTFSRSSLNALNLTNSINYMLNIDGIDWPLWKVQTTALEKDVLDIVTYHLPGTQLIKANDSVDLELQKLRESPSVMRGNCKAYSLHNNTVLVFLRVTSGSPGVLVALNPTPERVIVHFSKEIEALHGLKLTIQLHSKNYNETNYIINAKKNPDDFPLSAKSAIVMSYVP